MRQTNEASFTMLRSKVGAMNPGYLSLLLMVVTLILFASGWKDIIMRGITSKVILLFLFRGLSA